MRRRLPNVLAVAFTLLLAAAPALAHHGYATEFDVKSCTDIKGTLAGVDWVNPHGYINIDVTEASGKVENWHLETISPNSMRRANSTREDFLTQVGKPTVGRVCPTKPGGQPYRGTVEILILADGIPRILGQNIEGLTPEQVQQQVLPNLTKLLK